jgi:hypothetical protein
MMTFEPYPVPQEQPEVAQSKIWRTAALGDWWNLVLHQKLINCEGGVIRSTVMVQDPIISLFNSLFQQIVYLKCFRPTT